MTKPLTGLSLSALYVSGEYQDGGNNRREWGRTRKSLITSNGSDWNNLSITWRNATVRTARTIAAGNGQSLNENRLIVDYTVKLI